jgi:hypothetical protein
MTAHKGKDDQDDGQNAPLEIFDFKIDPVGVKDMKKDDIGSIRQQGKNADQYKLAGMEAEDAEQKDGDIKQQKKPPGFIGIIYTIHHNNNSDAHLDKSEAGIRHFQIEAGAKNYV